MKKLALVLGFCLSMGSIAFAQQTPTNLSAPTGTAPIVPASTADIKFAKVEHDFGTIKQGGPSDCEFKYTNTGKEPLILSNCQGSCGCTTPTCPKEPVLPGKTASIKVHYDSNRVGPFTKTVTVTSNAKSGPVMLTIKGTVEAKPAETAPAPVKN